MTTEGRVRSTLPRLPNLKRFGGQIPTIAQLREAEASHAAAIAEIDATQHLARFSRARRISGGWHIFSPTGSSETQHIRSVAYHYATWLYFHERQEIERLLRYGTPSDRLVELERRTNFLFPLSIRKNQNELFDAAGKVKAYFQSVPVMAWRTAGRLHALASVRRTADARRLAVLVGEAVLHRSACEFADTVLCTQENIGLWISKAYGVTVPKMSVGRILAFWNDLERSPFSVSEWGSRAGTPTKIDIGYYSREVDLYFASSEDPPEPSSLTSLRICMGSNSSSTAAEKAEQQAADDWVLEYAHAMNAVYAHQEERRQDRQRRGTDQVLKRAEKARQAEARVSEHIEAGMPGWTDGELLEPNLVEVLERVDVAEEANDGDLALPTRVARHEAA